MARPAEQHPARLHPYRSPAVAARGHSQESTRRHDRRPARQARRLRAAERHAQDRQRGGQRMTEPVDTAFDVDAWCRRIGYDGPRVPSLETLRAVIAAHADAIAYE